jgi:hypothetical protein
LIADSRQYPEIGYIIGHPTRRGHDPQKRISAFPAAIRAGLWIVFAGSSF